PHAVMSESAMLPPMTNAPSTSLRQTQTMVPTTNPHATPNSSAVVTSRRNVVISQARVTETERNAWMVTLIDCMLTLSLSASTIVRKNASTKLRANVASKK